MSNPDFSSVKAARLFALAFGGRNDDSPEYAERFMMEASNNLETPQLCELNDDTSVTVRQTIAETDREPIWTRKGWV